MRRFMNRRLVVYVLLIFLVVTATVFAVPTVVNLNFRVPLTMGIDLDKYNLDAGDAELYSELWAPIGSSNSFKVFVQNNSGSNWDFSIKMPDALRRTQGVNDPAEDYIDTRDVFWTVVYAGYWNGTSQVECKDKGSYLPGMQVSLLASGRRDDEGKSQAGIPFEKGKEAVIYRNETFNGSYKLQFAFKFIIKPPVSTTAGDYDGSIVFSMRTQ